jgi:hypothetical protein
VPHSLVGGLLTFISFGGVACYTWFLSYHPRQFYQLFVPCDEWHESAPASWRDPKTPKAVRFIAALQLTAGAVAGLLVALIGKS